MAMGVRWLVEASEYVGSEEDSAGKLKGFSALGSFSLEVDEDASW
jgi:hypothetical protein